MGCTLPSLVKVSLRTMRLPNGTVSHLHPCTLQTYPILAFPKRHSYPHNPHRASSHWYLRLARSPTDPAPVAAPMGLDHQHKPFSWVPQPPSPHFTSNRDTFSQPLYTIQHLRSCPHTLSPPSRLPSPHPFPLRSPISPPKLLLQKGPSCLHVA